MEKLRDIKKIIKKHNSLDQGLFIPVDLDVYLSKLNSHATIVNYYNEGKLAGFIAYYANNYKTKVGYLTLILIDEDFQGRGIGKLLIEFSINELKRKRFHQYSLEVLKSNSKGINFYSKFGFKIKEDRNDLFLMTLDL